MATAAERVRSNQGSRVLRFLAAACWIAGCALVVLALRSCLQERRGPVGVIDEPERRLTGVVAAEPATVRFTVRNPGSRPIRVVGLTEC